MFKAFLGASLAAFTKAGDRTKVQYPDSVDIDLIRVDPMLYQMTFRWPEEGYRCGATMITP